MSASHGARHRHGNCGVASVADRGESDRCDDLVFRIGSPGKFRRAGISYHAVGKTIRKLLCVSIDSSQR
jgi:hypothetical protein